MLNMLTNIQLKGGWEKVLKNSKVILITLLIVLVSSSIAWGVWSLPTTCAYCGSNIAINQQTYHSRSDWTHTLHIRWQCNRYPLCGYSGLWLGMPEPCNISETRTYRSYALGHYTNVLKACSTCGHSAWVHDSDIWEAHSPTYNGSYWTCPCGASGYGDVPESIGVVQ